MLSLLQKSEDRRHLGRIQTSFASALGWHYLCSKKAKIGGTSAESKQVLLLRSVGTIFGFKKAKIGGTPAKYKQVLLLRSVGAIFFRHNKQTIEIGK